MRGRPAHRSLLKARIARVKTDTLLVNEKEVVPLFCAYKFLELLENWRGYLIPHTGHWVTIEAANEFIEVVTSFLRRVETG
jgi:pimeloyl-ACP methyl ester carboxylesterase